ncbi:MAG: winged helix-turn-helix domain-containing protein [Elusimicrobia bacterium]|nr:winged helix-turn-helix domain-containing protein [Elusimicrobiota bacterium]
MQEEDLEAVILTRDEALLTTCRSRFADSRVGLTLARDQNGLRNALREKNIDAVILDAAHAPGVLDLDVEEAVSKLSSLLAPRVLMVLAEQEVLPEQVVKLLKLGAHDVVAKPVKPRILAEQLKALVRVFARKPRQGKKTLSSAANTLVMDYTARRCYIKEESVGLLSAKKEIKLTKIEFQVLYFLLQKKGAVVTYEDFRRHLWPTASSHREIIHTLHQLVTNIRKKLAYCPVRIENLRAEGFRLA